MDDIPVGLPLTSDEERMLSETHLFTENYTKVLCGKTGRLIATKMPEKVKCILCLAKLAEKAKEQNDTYAR